MTKRHVVRLTEDQRADLEGRFCGRLTLRERNRVQALLRSDLGDTDDEIAEALDICVATVVSVRKRFAAEGLEAAVVALACSPTPDGRAEWTAKLIAGRLVELHIVERISERTVGRVLKKAGSSRGRRRRGAYPVG